MTDDVYVGSVNVFVSFDEVRADDRAKELRGSDGVLLSKNVDGVLDRVRSNNNAVVSFGVAVGSSLANDDVQDAVTHETSMSPSRRQQTVISATE